MCFIKVPSAVRILTPTETKPFVDKVQSTAGSYIIVTKTGAGGLIVEAAASGRAAVATVRRFFYLTPGGLRNPLGQY